jgi:DNA polymerase-3 subunit epsilon
MVALAPPFEEVAGLVASQLHGRIFTAHNVPFDWAFVRNELAAAGREPLEVERLCTVRMGRHFLPDLQRHGLDALAAHYCITVEGRHRAMGDALATAQILLQLLEVARTTGIADWATLRDTLSGRRKKGSRRQRKRRAGPPVEGVLEVAPIAPSQPFPESE